MDFIPRERNAGLGRLIIAAVLELADQLRLERVATPAGGPGGR